MLIKNITAPDAHTQSTLFSVGSELDQIWLVTLEAESGRKKVSSQYYLARTVAASISNGCSANLSTSNQLDSDRSQSDVAVRRADKIPHIGAQAGAALKLTIRSAASSINGKNLNEWHISASDYESILVLGNKLEDIGREELANKLKLHALIAFAHSD